jgi:hypothetical protein
VVTTPARRRAPDSELATFLRTIRTRFGRSQAAIAHRAGCNRVFVTLVEGAERHCTRELFSVYLDMTSEEPEMKRRLLFTAGAAGVAGALVPDAALADTLAEPLTVDVDAWSAIVDQLGCDHLSLGATIMRPRLKNTLASLSALRDNGKLAALTAKVLVLYSRAGGQGDPYAQAQAYAVDSGDSATMAWVNGRIALGWCDNPATSHRAEAYADIALAQENASGTVGHLGIYLAHYAKARAGAVLGHADAALSHLQQAQYAYDALDPDIGGSEWSYEYARYCTDRSFILEAVGRPAEAVYWADQARPGTTGRFTTHLDLHPLVGRHRAGDRAAAAEARQIMAAIDPAQQSLTLRYVAAQAGATEYAAA